jgi:hypothetical protein
MESSSDVTIAELPRFTEMHSASGIAFLGMTQLRVYFFGSKLNVVSHHMPKEEFSDSTRRMA